MIRRALHVFLPLLAVGSATSSFTCREVPALTFNARAVAAQTTVNSGEQNHGGGAAGGKAHGKKECFRPSTTDK